ncbi:MAG: hypothetical protein ACRD8U_23925 [Pyrinomonadaceae bacterium]
MQSNKAPESKGFKVTLIVLLGLAAFSSAMKDLDHIQQFVGSVQKFSGSWSHADGLLASNQGVVSDDEGSCSNESILAKTSFDIDVEADEDGIEPEVGGEAEVAANRMATLSGPRLTANKPTRVLKGGIFARGNHARWADIVELKSLNQEVTFDLPMIVLTETKAAFSNTDKVPEFPLSLLNKANRKQTDVKSHNLKREWLLRRIDGNINVRRSS